MMEDGDSAIEWRVTDASKSSPLRLTVEAFSKQYAVNIDERARIVVDAQLNGLTQLQISPARPAYFTDRALIIAERIFDRVTDGLEQTTVDYGDSNVVVLHPTNARNGIQNIREVLTPTGRPYREVSSVEGRFTTIGRDGFGRPLIIVRDRITGNDIKCVVSDKQARAEVEHLQVSDVWRGRRVRVYGELHFKAVGRLAQIDVSNIRFLRDNVELPTIDDIVDPDFTLGVTTEEYIKRLREGGVS